MAKRKFNFNVFDLISILIITVFLGIILFSYNNKPNLGMDTVIVEVKISNIETINAILPKVKISQTVYYSGTKYPVQQLSYRTSKNKSGEIDNLYITLKGPGDIVTGNSIFNGQRVYVNQKVEIHADYQAQGYVTNYYAD